MYIQIFVELDVLHFLNKFFLSEHVGKLKVKYILREPFMEILNSETIKKKISPSEWTIIQC